MIRAAAFIIEDNITDIIADKLVHAMTEKANSVIESATDALTNWHNFLEASSTKQAASIIELREIADKLSENSIKLYSLANTTVHPTPNKTWPSVPTFLSSQASLPSPVYNLSSSDNITHLQQRVVQAARSILVATDPSNEEMAKFNVEANPIVIRAQLNDKLDELYSKSDKDSPSSPNSADKPSNKIVIRGI